MFGKITAKLVRTEHQEYIEVAEDFGLPVDEYRDLADELRALGVAIGDDVIPSIRTIEEIDDA